MKIVRVWVAAWHMRDFFDYFFFFLFNVTNRYRIISVDTLSVPRIILRGENKVHSFIFGKLPHQVQILWYNHILCKKANFSLFAKFTEFLNYISFPAFIQLGTWMRNRIVMRTKLVQVEIKLTNFSKNQG